MKFPSIVHLTRELPEADDEWFMVHTNGVADIDTHGTPIAIYQLVSIGTVDVQRTFSDRKNKKRKAGKKR